jgi:glucosyl-3-phosphoglycerate synthase
VPDAGGALTQFLQVDGEWVPSSTRVSVSERPPMRDVLVR